MQNNQPVIILLTPGFAKNEADSNCLPFAQSLIRAINQDYSSIKIIILAFQYPFTSTRYEWHGNKVLPFGGKERGKLMRRLLWLRVWQKLRRIKRRNNVIGLFSLWCGECAFVGNLFGSKYGIKHRCWILGQDAKENNKYVNKINPAPEQMVAVSDFIAEEFFKNYLVKPQHIIPNGIDKNLYQNSSLERTIDIMGAGSLIPLKRYEMFIYCVNELKKNISNIKSIIAGKGSEEKFLRKEIRKLNLQDNISLTGELDHKEVLQLMQQSKIFLHPSSFEGFSMVCQEALYAGCHVISFCKPMNINFEHWHVVKTKEEMKEKALEILNEPGIDNEPVTAFSIKRTAESIVKLFVHNDSAIS
jgi:glycosyltransferase involved in cell wall biosynthesis